MAEKLNLIKAQFLGKWDSKPGGRHYTYNAGGHDVKVGDLVQLNESGQGIVTAVNVDESEIASFRDKLQTIVGKVEQEQTNE